MQVQAPKTYKQQIQKLKNKDIVITDDVVAEEFLQSVNYYRLKGYTHILAHKLAHEKADKSMKI